MSTSSAGRATVGVLPASLTLVRLLGQDTYEAQFRLSARAGQPREWLVVTPGNELHPHHQPRHWLGDPTEGWQGPAAQLPCALHCPVNLSGLRTDTEHRATIYLALRSGPDEVTTERLTVIVTPARAPAAVPEPALPLAALGTPVAEIPPARPLPLRAVAPDQPIGRERFCALCGHAFAAAEKFCPKDGRKREARGGA
jgi:hypothetical protein